MDGAAHDPMLPRRFRVTEALDELGDVRTLVLEPLDGGPMDFLPGQFNMLYAFGVGEAAISISGDPAGGRLIHTIRKVGAISAALANARPGDVIGVRGPFGTPWPVAEQVGRHIVFVAGGLGLAPLRPAIYHVLTHREQYEGLTLVFGARGPAELLFAEEIHAWKARFDTEVEVTVDHATPGWTGRVGVVTTVLDHALGGVNAANVSAFVCGPEVMMRFSAEALEHLGVDPARIWLSMERNMKCAVGFCGHCQWGEAFICRDGPVFDYGAIAGALRVKEL